MAAEPFAQFANLLHAAPVAPRPRKSAKLWSIEELLRESDRKPDASRHVPKPQPPTWRLGSASEVSLRALEWHAQARKSCGRARRQKTSPALACAVVSFPRSCINQWPAYREAVVAHFQSELGDRLIGVVEHLDERHPHVHIYMVPRPGEDFGIVHPGYNASRRARRQTGNHVSTSFRKAMSAWQDKLYAAVSKGFGLARLGPARARLDRLVWSVVEKARKRAERLDEEAERNRAAAGREAAELLARTRQGAVAHLEKEHDLTKREQAFAELKAQAQRDWEQLRTEQTALRELAQAVEQRQRWLADMPASELIARCEELEALLATRSDQLDEVKFRNQMLEQRLGNQNSSLNAVRQTPRPIPQGR